VGHVLLKGKVTYQNHLNFIFFPAFDLCCLALGNRIKSEHFSSIYPKEGRRHFLQSFGTHQQYYVV